MFWKTSLHESKLSLPLIWKAFWDFLKAKRNRKKKKITDLSSSNFSPHEVLHISMLYPRIHQNHKRGLNYLTGTVSFQSYSQVWLCSGWQTPALKVPPKCCTPPQCCVSSSQTGLGSTSLDSSLPSSQLCNSSVSSPSHSTAWTALKDKKCPGHSPAVVSFISFRQFNPAICAAAITDLLSASVKKLGTCFQK